MWVICSCVCVQLCGLSLCVCGAVVALNSNFCSAKQESAIFYDMDAVKATLLELKTAFSPHFVHTFAVKSAPLPALVRFMIENGIGMECASFAEVMMAIRFEAPHAFARLNCKFKAHLHKLQQSAFSVRLYANQVIAAAAAAALCADAGVSLQSLCSTRQPRHAWRSAR